MKWTPGRLLNWGQNIGAGTRAVVQWQLENRPHPEQGYRACLGLAEPRLRLTARSVWRPHAAGRSTIGAPHRKRIIAILKAKLDQHPDLFPAADTAAATASRTHDNVRGADYFRDSTTNTETTTTDEGDDDSCLSNQRSIH